MGKITLLVIVLFGLTAGIASRQLAFDDDEFQHAHMAWLLARGEVPHRDFFEHHLPLYHFLISPLTLHDPGPERILWLRGLSVLIAIGTLACTARAMRIWTGQDSPGILALMAFSPIFFVKMIEVRPEGLSLLLAVAALCCLKNPGALLSAGLLSGAMVMGSQKFVFLGFGLLWIAWREHGGRSLWRFGLGGAVFPLLISGYYLFTEALGPAFHELVQMNLGWKESFSPTMYAGQFWKNSALLIVSGLLGQFSGISPSARRASRILILAGLAGVLLNPIPFRQTFLMLYPGLALGGALCWQRLTELFESRKFSYAGLLCLTGFGLLPAAAGLRQELQEHPNRDLARMHEMDRRGNAPVFDGRCLLFYRPHVGYYPWMHRGLMLMLDPKVHARESIDALVAAGYPDILWDYRVDQMSPILHDFLQRNYVPLSPKPLWVPGQKIDRSRLRTGTELNIPVEGDYIVDWRGGNVTLAGKTITPKQHLHLAAGPVRIQARGFVRDFVIHRAGASE